ncbi:5'/3'-nucleotidase SurE [Anaplasma phagocytophilum]|uniref:5'/3'-nucleotidase SurE n=1 Tax=Anaplasma phagocytophilum TaxID=948 RepID=UPI00200D6FC8|nr:5'/3'-nucleotidase SurE [Anaplasma phagocytophilum]UQD53903.1 5'/3'-nucleotidase SurE [Anaplasma phagocytophilum]
MRVLLTNDDGFFAQGMQVLKGIVSQAFSEVWISAPARNCSGMSRSISVGVPVEARKVNDREYTISGTPVDSAVLGLHIMKSVAGVLPDLVLSGINYGSNVGSKVLYSGTIAAAAAAASMGIPSIAISQEYCGTDINWGNSEKVVLDIVKQLMDDPRWDRKSVMSINIPHFDILGMHFTEQGDYCPCGDVADAPGQEPDCTIYTICDVNRETKLERFQKASSEMLRAGYIIVTPVGSDLTDHSTLNRMLGS